MVRSEQCRYFFALFCFDFFLRKYLLSHFSLSTPRKNGGAKNLGVK